MKKDLEKIINILWGLNNKDRGDFLKVLFTEREIKEFSNRIEILTDLKNGETQRVISKKLGISVTTVTRGNKHYQKNKELIDKYLI
ncbi:MAG: Trp family transcriptional regulator [Candidatus Gracilibacteria bacterium]|nr:Trp family transcriptional regulator [Candidatus Gracilibacteria bacterium]MDQ7022848.1 Trp family transcriptional regulator [Candidatus Gracilibacteria bacterium]